MGHTAAAIAWLGPLLDTTPDADVAVWSVADYLAAFPLRSAEDLDAPLHSAARAQGERGAQRGPKDTVARLEIRLNDLGERLTADDLNRLLDLRPTLPAAIPLDEFLRTRVVELVVHGEDLAASVGVESNPPRTAAVTAIETLMTVAVAQHGPVEVIRALARRERSRAAVFPVL